MRWLLLSVLYVSVFAVRGQNDIVFSHYMLNPTYFNPSFVANARISHSIFQFRSQWTGYQPSFDASGGAPLTQAFTGVIPMNGKLSGFGLIATNDQLGPVNNVIVGLPIAITFKTRATNLTLGVTPMMYSQVLNFNLLRFVNPQDPLNLGTRESQLKANFTAGVLATHQSGLVIGISAQNLTQPLFDYGLDSLSNQLKRSFSVISAFRLLIGRKLALKPSMHLRSDLNTFSFDFGGILNYQEKMWAGLSYRYAEAVTFFFGYSVLQDNKLQLGYALDYVVDEQSAKQPTSQEFFIRYNLPNLVIGGRKQVKTPRFAY